MASSEPEKLFPGQVGFPTPNAAPEETGCRVFVIPDSEEYYALLMGALDALRRPYNWYINGALDQQEAADLFAAILDAAYAAAEDGATCPADTPTPFWDTVTDADDSYPAGELTPWYGTAVVTYASPPDVTFTEQAFIWLFAGFMAYSGAIGGAIAFLTIAPKFVIALKTGDIGAVVDIIVDASRVGRYDTHSDTPGIMRIPIVGNPDLDEHQIYIVKDDDPDTTVTLIRDELNPDDVAPPNRRYVVDGDKVQIQGADGTWGDNAGADPRSSPAYVYPVITADDVPCQSASNMSRWINNLIDDVLVVIPVALDASGLLTLLAGLLLELGPFGILIDLVLALAFILFSAGTTALAAAFTSGVYDQLTCIFFCNVDSDGRMSPEQLTAAQALVDAEIGGLAATVLDAMFFLMGNVGLTNAGTVDDGEPVDCSGCACAWCYEWLDVSELVADSWSHSSDETYSQQWTAEFAATLTHVEFAYTWNSVDGSGGSSVIYAVWDGNFSNQLIWYNPLDTAPGSPVSWDGTQVVAQLDFGLNGNSSGGGAVVAVTSLRLVGTGTRPGWTHGHEC